MISRGALTLGFAVIALVLLGALVALAVLAAPPAPEPLAPTTPTRADPTDVKVAPAAPDAEPVEPGSSEPAHTEAESAPAIEDEPSPLPPDQRSITCFRGNPERSLSGVGTVPRHPRLLWRFQTKTKNEGPYEQRGDPSLTPGVGWHGLGWTGQPCILDGSVYFGSVDSYVYSLDLATGQERWHYGTHHNVKGSISVLDGAIYHGGRDNKIRRYSLRGEMVWETRIGQDTDSNPILVEGKLVIGGEDNSVYALDPETGVILWRYTPTAGSCECSPCYAEGTIVIGSSAGGLYCLDPEDGSLIWQLDTGGDGDPTPVYMDGCAYHAIEIGNGASGKVSCVDVGSGEYVWRKDLPRGVWATVAVNPVLKRLYVGCNNGTLYCLDPTDGSTIWERKLTGARIWSSPVVVDGCILVGVRDGTLWCLDEEISEPLWVFDEGFDIDATPAVADGKIVIGSQSGWVYCIGEDPQQVDLDPHWFRAGPEFSVATDHAGAAPTVVSSAPDPETYQDTHAACSENLRLPVYGPGYHPGLFARWSRAMARLGAG